MILSYPAGPKARVFKKRKKIAAESDRDVMTESEIRMIQLLGLEMGEGAVGQGVHGASGGQKKPNTVSPLVTRSPSSQWFPGHNWN